jgi:hypothetical protein
MHQPLVLKFLKERKDHKAFPGVFRHVGDRNREYQSDRFRVAGMLVFRTRSCWGCSGFESTQPSMDEAVMGRKTETIVCLVFIL